MRKAIPALILAAGYIAFAAPGAVEGNPAGIVKVQIFEDLQSGGSAGFETMLDQKLLPKYGGRVAFVHRDFPLGRDDWAREAAIASRWVFERSPALGVDFRHEILSEQDSISKKSLRSWLEEFAIRNRLDPRAIVACLTDFRLGALVDQDLASGRARGVTKVPAVFVNGQNWTETIVYDDIAKAIEDALK